MGLGPGAGVRRRLLLLGAIFLTLSCGHSGALDVAILASNNDQEIYEAGKKAVQHREFENARKLFKRIIDGFPQSAYGGPARLALADSHFTEGGTANYILAASEYRDYLQLFPTKADSPYAEFQVGEAYFKQRNSPDRDQVPTEKALEQFQRLLDRFPDSKYTELGRQRVVVCRQSLARSEFLAGYFYEKSRKAYRASIIRYQGVLSEYPDYDHMDEVLYHLGFSLSQQGRNAEALPILAKLTKNYPDSPLTKKGVVLLEHAQKGTPAAPPSPAPSPSIFVPGPTSSPEAVPPGAPEPFPTPAGPPPQAPSPSPEEPGPPVPPASGGASPSPAGPAPVASPAPAASPGTSREAQVEL
jgi:outer membrane protein assembly factor BamD